MIENQKRLGITYAASVLKRSAIIGTAGGVSVFVQMFIATLVLDPNAFRSVANSPPMLVLALVIAILFGILFGLIGGAVGLALGFITHRAGRSGRLEAIVVGVGAFLSSAVLVAAMSGIFNPATAIVALAVSLAGSLWIGAIVYQRVVGGRVPKS